MNRVANILIFLALIPLTLFLSGNLFLFLNRALNIGPPWGTGLLDAFLIGTAFTPFSIFVVLVTIIILYILQRKFKWTVSKQYTVLFTLYALVFLVSFGLYFVWLIIGSS